MSRGHFEDVGSAAVGRGTLNFDNVQLEACYKVGDEGEGFRQVMQGFDYSRALIGLQCLASADASLGETWSYVTKGTCLDYLIAEQASAAATDSTIHKI